MEPVRRMFRERSVGCSGWVFPYGDPGERGCVCGLFGTMKVASVSRGTAAAASSAVRFKVLPMFRENLKPSCTESEDTVE